MHRFLLLMGHDTADAEDATQETFLAAWRSAGAFRGSGGARSWLLTIGRHALGRARRQTGPPGEVVSIDELGRDAGWGDAALAPVATQRLELADGWSRLTHEEREVLLLRDVEGFSGEEAAEVLGLSLAAQKSRLHRARLRLLAEVGRAHG